MSVPRNLYEWFARSADRFGDAHTALEAGEERLSYGELRHLAERLAGRLIAANGGVAPRRVGLLTDRSVTTYAGYLAVLRAGAAVVPLNPEYPAARTKAMAAAAGVDLVLADPRGAGSGPGVPLLVAGPRDLAEPGTGGGPVPPCPSSGDDLAYVIFTSGSTGAPKGLPIRHRNVCALLSHAVPGSEAGPGSRLSQAWPLTSDGAVYDMFVAWGSGGTLVVPTGGPLLSPVSFINDRRITHWFSVPSLMSFALRLGTLTPGAMPTLRWSRFGGEAVPMDALRAWQAAAPDGRLEAVYGPTEVTVISTGYRFPRSVADWPLTPNGTAPIGTGFPAVETALLDENGNPGTTGELYLRGPQRFPGYLDARDNAGRFALLDEGDAAAPPARPHPTERHWYRTGDRVTLRDGQLVHLGRTDHQVKIRGHRIELEEIEAALREVNAVRDAVVLAVPGPDGEPELAAAVTGSAGSGPIHDALATRLPAHMLPHRITAFAQLPLNSNGKLDRHALRAALTGVPRR
ncbi:D-alanine--poly(phosphoribitol) ligase [Streptomyces sp. A7024]|uniref:D-alanine--poly(Phosphoribitol) ligase n=1 Tax=Streptomyces coryli TaxID=1128680 RepID=A0A6G4TTJ2_9ACTN|nr:amino acid adenylation domain-containing protein [Streptomyces coryli]NGN62860.1 D-alanine--poly(phosphoribitol) ligase [Streptomyces coryli]